MRRPTRPALCVTMDFMLRENRAVTSQRVPHATPVMWSCFGRPQNLITPPRKKLVTPVTTESLPQAEHQRIFRLVIAAKRAIPQKVGRRYCASITTKFLRLAQVVTTTFLLVEKVRPISRLPKSATIATRLHLGPKHASITPESSATAPRATTVCQQPGKMPLISPRQMFARPVTASRVGARPRASIIRKQSGYAQVVIMDCALAVKTRGILLRNLSVVSVTLPLLGCLVPLVTQALSMDAMDATTGSMLSVNRRHTFLRPSGAKLATAQHCGGRQYRSITLKS